MSTRYELTDRQVNGILAALRCWQAQTSLEDRLNDPIATGDEHRPIDDDEIDGLCEYINCERE